MPKKTEALTEAEQPIMEVLWNAGSGTVSEVLAAMETSKPLAFNTVQTLLRILEQKGFVHHVEEGRAFRYLPSVARATALRSAVQTVVRRFFAGSPGELAVNLLENEQLSPDDLARIRRLMAAAERRK